MTTGALRRAHVNGADFQARYRLGNGSAGNVGSDTLAHAVTNVQGVVALRNPLPATGGVDPETPEEFTFGQTIYTSPFIAAAQDVEGVSSATMTVFRRMDDPSIDGVAPAKSASGASTSSPSLPSATTLDMAGATLSSVAVFQNCCAAMEKVDQPAEAPGTLGARTSAGSGDCTCGPTPAAGYRGLENQLYRVEVHQGGNEAAATFKWSRENASVVVAITGVSGRQVYVDSLGFDANLGFSPGQWVEITDDSYQFGQNPNQPGDLYQIQAVTPGTLSVAMTQPVASVDPGKNARMRRWDRFGSRASSQGVSLHPTSPYRGVRIIHLFSSWEDAFDPNYAARVGFTHLVAGAKSHPAIGRRLEERVRREDPAYFRRCEKVLAAIS